MIIFFEAAHPESTFLFILNYFFWLRHSHI